MRNGHGQREVAATARLGDSATEPARDDTLDVRAVLKTLTPQQRIVVGLFYGGGYPIAGVAEAMDLSDGAVKYHLHAAPNGSAPRSRRTGMLEPDDAALFELLQRPTISVADEDRAFGTIVARARRRVRRRRRLIATGALLIVLALIGSVVVINRRSDDRVPVETAHHLSAAEVTFAVFGRPATAADAAGLPPNHGGFFYGDPRFGSRLAIRSDREKIYVYGTLRSCRTPQQCAGETTPGGTYFCVGIVLDSLSATSCLQAADIAELGGEVGTMGADGASSVVYGMVPDFVTRVTYDGREVPIVNNAFVVDGADDASRVTFSTPDGDKTPLPTTPSTRTTPTAPASTTARAVLLLAKVPPVSDECTIPIRHLEDGNVTPLLCPGGGVNTNAWGQYVFNRVGATALILRSSKTMQLGRAATANAVYQAMCSDYTNLYGTNPVTTSAESLASVYYGWTFVDSRITSFDHQHCPAP